MADRGLQKNASLLAVSRDAIAARVQIGQLDFRRDTSLPNRVPQQPSGAGRIAAAPIGSAREQFAGLIDFGLRGIEIRCTGHRTFCTIRGFALARGSGCCLIFMMPPRRAVRFCSRRA